LPQASSRLPMTGPAVSEGQEVDAAVGVAPARGGASADFRTFSKNFVMDGRPITLLSGSLHYWRVPRDYWWDRLLRLREAGFNALETYVPWSLHQRHPPPVAPSFEGSLDLLHFLRLARRLGLMVILRPGPYICSEMDLGGLPSWLLARGARLRTYDPTYIAAVDEWWGTLLPMVAPEQVQHGGAVIMVQVENEYGNYAQFSSNKTAGAQYMAHLVTLLRQADITLPLLTSDPPQRMQLGAYLEEFARHENLLQTSNFGKDRTGQYMRQADMAIASLIVNQAQHKRPRMTMELWGGWFDHWGAHSHARVNGMALASGIDYMLRKHEQSLNVYMFHGGTSWGFSQGSCVFKQKFSYVTTSYDYDTLLDEGGRRTAKFYEVKKVLQAWKAENPKMGRLGLKTMPAVELEVDAAAAQPGNSSKELGRILMQEWLPLLDCDSALPAPVISEVPLTMEQLPIHNGGGQSFGYTLYRSTVTQHAGGRVELAGVRDRIQTWQSWCSRTAPASSSDRAKGFVWQRPSVSAPCPEIELLERPEDGSRELRLELLVENLGRVFMTSKFETLLHEHRGISGATVLPEGTALGGWEIFPLDFEPDYIQERLSSSACWSPLTGNGEPISGMRVEGAPVLFRATLRLSAEEIASSGDQWIDFGDSCAAAEADAMWRKGAVFINGFNLGRYWAEAGPQRTLYLPAALLHPGNNQLLVFEQQHTSSRGTLPFLDLLAEPLYMTPV